MICKTCDTDKKKKEFRPGFLSCRKCNNIKNRKSQHKFNSKPSSKERQKEYIKEYMKEYKTLESFIRNRKKHRVIIQARHRKELHRRYIYKLLYMKRFPSFL